MRADARGPSEPRAPSARGEARAWRYGATSVLLLGLVAARPSTAQPLDGEPAPASAARARLQFASGLCVTRAALVEGVEAMLGRTVFADDPEARAAELAVEGEERAEGARRVVRFVLRRADGSLVGERVLRAPQTGCGLLLEQSVVVLALLLDVGRDRVELRALPAPEIPRRGEVADTHGGRGGFVAHATSRAAWRRGELEAGVAASVGLLPEPSGGFVVGGGVSVGQRFTLRARGWWLASRRVLHEDGRGAETSALGLTFELCTRLGGIERFDAEGCAGAAAGWLRVDAVGLSDGVQGESLPTAAMRTALRVRWRFGAAWLALALGAEAAVGQARLVRDQGRATEREIHRVGEVLGRGELLVGTGFPSEP